MGTTALFSLACRSGLGNRGSYFCGNPQAVRNPGFHGTHRLLPSSLLQGWACLQHPCGGPRCPWETQCICQVEAPSICLERWAPIPTPNLLAPKGRGRAQLVEELGELFVLSYLLGLLCLPRVPGKKKKSVMAVAYTSLRSIQVLNVLHKEKGLSHGDTPRRPC